MTSPEQAYELGRRFGFYAVAALVASVTLTGIIVNVVASRRAGTNKNCAFAAVFAFAALLALGVGGFITRAAGVSQTFGGLPGFVALVALVIAVIFAINGLAEIKRFPGAFDRGRRRAIATLSLPFLFAACIVAAVWAHSSGHPVFSSEIGGTAGENLIVKAWNFQLIAPPPWVRTNAAPLNPAACAALARQGPQMFAIIVAEDTSKSGAVAFPALVETAKASLTSNAHEIVSEQAQDETGFKGWRIDSLSTAGGNRFYFVRWLTQSGDTFYQIVTWGPQPAREQIIAESRKLTAGFRLLDPNLNPLPAVERAPATFSSEKFGYSIDLQNTLWNRRWPTLAQEVPFAEFGVLTARSTAAFCVIPVWLGDDDLAFEPIATALAGRIGVPFPDDSLFAMRNIRHGPVRGRTFAWERKQGDVNLLYRLRVLRGRGYGYLLAAWMNKKSEASSEFLDLAMDCVSFAEKVDRDSLLLGDQLRSTHSLVWNDIGITLLRDKNVAAGLAWLKRAYEIEPTNLVPLANYADTLVKAGRSADALAAIDSYIAADPRPALRRLRAQVLSAAGKHPEAIRALLDLRQAAPEDQETGVVLIDAYLAAQRHTEAIAECDRFTAARGELVGILQRKGVAQASLKRFAEAKITLEKAREKEPANAEIKKLLEQLAALSAASGK